MKTSDLQLKKKSNADMLWSFKMTASLYNKLISLHDVYIKQLDIIVEAVYKSEDEQQWIDLLLFLNVTGVDGHLFRKVKMKYSQKFGGSL